MLRDIYMEIVVKASSADNVSPFELLRIKRDFYKLDTRRLKEILPKEHGKIEYYGSLIYKELIVVSGYFHKTDRLSLYKKKSFVVFRGSKILGLIETTWSSELDFNLNVFMDSIEIHELTMAIEIPLSQELGIDLVKARDKIIEEITGSPVPSFTKMYPSTRFPFYVEVK